MRVHVSVDMPAHHVSAISGSLLPTWFPHSGSQSVCSAIGSTQLTAAAAACQLAAAKPHYCSLRLSESLGGSPHAYPPSFIDFTCPNQKIPTTCELTVSSPRFIATYSYLSSSAEWDEEDCQLKSIYWNHHLEEFTYVTRRCMKWLKYQAMYSFSHKIWEMKAMSAMGKLAKCTHNNGLPIGQKR